MNYSFIRLCGNLRTQNANTTPFIAHFATNTNYSRRYSRGAENDSASEDFDISPSSEGPQSPLPFEAIPGPPPLPILGNRMLFSSFGRYPLSHFWDSLWRMRRDFGPIVRVAEVKPEVNMLWLFDPEHIKKIFHNEGDCPFRPPLDLLQTYRLSTPEVYSSLGLVTGNGPEWKRLRRAIPDLLKLKTVSQYRPKQAQVAKELTDAIKDLSSDSISCRPGVYLVQDMVSLLFRYTLEAIGIVVLGKSQGCLSSADRKSTSIIKANEDFLTALGDNVFSLPFYKFFPTPSYRKLKQSSDFINSVVDESLQMLEQEFQSSAETFAFEQPFVFSLLNNPSLSRQDRQLLLAEIYMGGIDATATTIAFCLYFLSQSPDWQAKLYEEVKGVDPATHDLQNLPIARGVMKESFRLRPSPTGVARILQQDLIISGYLVPKGVLLQGIPFLASRDLEYHYQPNLFNPARWDRNPLSCSNFKIQQHPFSVLPFSHGVRMCPGRRLAEQEILLALITICQKFIMEDSTAAEVGREEVFGAKRPPFFKEEGVGQVLRLNMMPERPIAIKFIARK